MADVPPGRKDPGRQAGSLCGGNRKPRGERWLLAGGGNLRADEGAGAVFLCTLRRPLPDGGAGGAGFWRLSLPAADGHGSYHADGAPDGLAGEKPPGQKPDTVAVCLLARRLLSLRPQMECPADERVCAGELDSADREVPCGRSVQPSRSRPAAGGERGEGRSAGDGFRERSNRGGAARCGV